jgi:hypothetical protein
MISTLGFKLADASRKRFEVCAVDLHSTRAGTITDCLCYKVG